MGQPKQLLPIGDRPAIVHCLACITGAGIDDIVVVTGHGGEAVRQAIRDFSATVTENLQPSTGMAGSVRAALSVVDPCAEGVLIYPCDHPLVNPATLRGMLRAYAGWPESIIVPRYLGRNGHPSIFPRSILGELRPGVTLRDILWKHPDRVIRFDTDDEGVILGMNTPEEYQVVLDRFGTQGDGTFLPAETKGRVVQEKAGQRLS